MFKHRVIISLISINYLTANRIELNHIRENHLEENLLDNKRIRNKISIISIFISIITAICYFSLIANNYTNSLSTKLDAPGTGVFLSSINLIFQFFILLLKECKDFLFSILSIIMWLYSFLLIILVFIAIIFNQQTLYKNIFSTICLKENDIYFLYLLFCNWFLTGVSLLTSM
jgi:hypothetical protein